jgi:uncharacterized protein (TIGR02284 family)
MTDADVIATLNDLLETSKDGEYGFSTCAQAVKNEALKTMFEEAAHRCAEGAGQLEAEIRRLGGTPSQSGSVGGSLHRGWIDIKSAITGMDEAAILSECERGEDVAKAAYESALKKDLPAEVRSLVERQYKVVKQNHDRVRDLRNAVSP